MLARRKVVIYGLFVLTRFAGIRSGRNVSIRRQTTSISALERIGALASYGITSCYFISAASLDATPGG